MRRLKILGGSVAVVMLMALLVACGGGDDDSNGEGATATGGASAQVTATAEPEAEATATEEAEEPTATTAAIEETATVDREPTADATKPAGDQPVGTASVDDETEDVVNILMNEPDDPMPGIDLTNVLLEGDGDQLAVTIETVGDIAGELSDDVDVSFDVHLWQDGMPAYALSLQKNGSDDWEASVTDFTEFPADEESIETEITLSGSTLSASFPVALLPGLQSEFEWYSSVMLSEAGSLIGPDSWFDGAPENVIALLADPDEFVEFPQ